MKIISISFKSKPDNYGMVDKNITRSAQPEVKNLVWLKNQGVTDIINFRTMYDKGITYDEKVEIEKLGMRYHQIPSYSRHPDENKINTFLKLVESIKEQNGRIHMHCKAGADRTGMYAFIYKTINKLGTIEENIIEWIKMGHNIKIYPELIGKTIKLLQKNKQI